eukprot:1390517-Amorphochlora_amoeboformis.AAC.1
MRFIVLVCGLHEGGTNTSVVKSPPYPQEPSTYLYKQSAPSRQPWPGVYLGYKGFGLGSGISKSG